LSLFPQPLRLDEYNQVLVILDCSFIRFPSGCLNVVQLAFQAMDNHFYLEALSGPNFNKNSCKLQKLAILGILANLSQKLWTSKVKLS